MTIKDQLDANLFRQIYLPCGKVVLVDNINYDDLTQFNWSYKGNGYAQRATWNPKTKKAGTELMHRRILKAPKGIYVDHINGNGLDNRKENLRLCENKQNVRNSKKRKSKYSKYKGVTKVHGKYWAAQITVNYKNFSLGYFKTEKEAALMYDKAAILHFGEFAKLNFRENV